MNKQEDVKYQKVIVLAVHMPETGELLFRENRCLLRQYCRFIEDCVHVITGGKCLDLILHNNYICGVYKGADAAVFRSVGRIADHIQHLAERINEEDYKTDGEKLIIGVGIAAGTAIRLNIENSFGKWRNSMWIGSVMNRAHAMSQMSICDGNRQVFIAE